MEGRAVYCPPSFDALKERLEIKERDGGILVIPYEKLCSIVRLLLEAVSVDEEWYKATYPDVAQGIASGASASAKAHYVEFGYFEGRLPHEIVVDEQWYETAYPDVAVGARAGGPSPKDHFFAHGYREGRLPVPPLPSPLPKIRPPAAGGAAAAGSPAQERPLRTVRSPNRDPGDLKITR